MTTLVVGASGATGRLLVAQLLAREEPVRVIVRSPQKLPQSVRDREKLTVIHASLLELSDAELAEHVQGCQAVASCLGHNLTLKGIFGPPRRLVTDAVRRLCAAIQANHPPHPVKFVLMNTTANRNRDLNEPVSAVERIGADLLRPKMTGLGADVAGVVEAVGSQITQFKPGDEVFGEIAGQSGGGFAEYAVGPSEPWP